MSVTLKLGESAPAPEQVFDAASLARSYAFLDECPERLLNDVITLPVGSLDERVRGVCIWRDALLEGRLPPQDAWPPPEIGGPMRRALDQLGIARFCKGQPDLVDDILADVVMALNSRHETVLAELARRIRELEAQERVRLQGLHQLAAKLDTSTQHKERHAEPIRLDKQVRQRLREHAEREIAGDLSEVDAKLIDIWRERVRVWVEIASVFGDLGELVGRGWDLTQGILHHTGWRDLLRLRELLERLPQLRELVRALGRLHDTDASVSIAERVFIPMRRLEEARQEVRTPLVPADTRGVERSASVARMLPAEAAMLGHPKLRMLWHARRSEQALLTYRVEGVEIEQTLVEPETTEESQSRRPMRERGPILAVIDTSGSMHGLPETVAKALVLEALRTAHAERRHCRLYSFSGPGQVAEHELDLSPKGVGSLLSFLYLSFGGGTDPTDVIGRVLRQLEEGKWAQADVLFVSDGVWSAHPKLTDAVRLARARGVRFHGIQIGNRDRTGLHEICTPVHVFTDWVDLLDEKLAASRP